MGLELAEFDLTEEHLEFRDVVRRFMEAQSPIAEVRRVMEAGATGYASALWAAAGEELGLAGLAIPEAHGGQGFALKELGIALGEVGRALAPIPLLASAGLAARVVGHVAGDAAGPWLEPIAAGHPATLAWTGASGDWAPGATAVAATPDGEGVRLEGTAEFVLAAAEAERLFVIARVDGAAGDDALGLYAVEASAEGLSIMPRRSLDVTRPVFGVAFEATPARVVGTAGGQAKALQRGLDEATGLLCAEMAGGMRRVLESAVDYAGERFQFSRPIGSFQAIKHKCADLLIDYEGARSASAGALRALDEADPEASLLVSVAKSHLGPAFVRMATENGQIQGGVGYTWEYDAHLYYRRAMASKVLLGDESVHRARLTMLVAASLEGEVA